MKKISYLSGLLDYFKNHVVILFLLTLIFNSCTGQNKNNSNSVTLQKDESKLDSLAIVASKFIWFDEYSNPKTYVVEEPDINDVYLKHPEWVHKYFHDILNRYSLRFNDKVLISCYLYLENDKKYLELLSSDSSLTKEQKYIISLHTNNFKIIIK